jgi:hypothetical protein
MAETLPHSAKTTLVVAGIHNAYFFERLLVIIVNAIAIVTNQSFPAPQGPIQKIIISFMYLQLLCLQYLPNATSRKDLVHKLQHAAAEVLSHCGHHATAV